MKLKFNFIHFSSLFQFLSLLREGHSDVHAHWRGPPPYNCHGFPPNIRPYWGVTKTSLSSTTPLIRSYCMGRECQGETLQPNHAIFRLGKDPIKTIGSDHFLPANSRRPRRWHRHSCPEGHSRRVGWDGWGGGNSPGGKNSRHMRVS